jgi:hypothetical protein
VTDNQTGLQWEKKTGTVGHTISCSQQVPCAYPHDVNNIYTWSVSTSGAPDGSAFTQFLATLNTPPCFAGHCDWRLPTLTELQAILLAPYPCGTLPCIDPTFGPTGGAALNTHLYWSTDADACCGWVVCFCNGGVGRETKSNSNYARAVRTPS